MNKLILCILLLACYSCGVFKSTSHSLVEFPVVFNAGDTLASKLHEIVDINSHIHKDTPMIETTLKKNSHIPDWRNIPPHSKLQLFVNKDFLDELKWKNFKLVNKLSEKDIIYPHTVRRERDFNQHKTTFITGRTTSLENGKLTYATSKLTQTYSSKLYKEYRYYASMSFKRIRNIKYSIAEGSTSQKKTLNDFSLVFSKRYNIYFDMTAGYNFQKDLYITEQTLTEVSITPKTNHHLFLGLKFYALEKLSLEPQISLISGFESGVGTKLDINYRFSLKKSNLYLHFIPKYKKIKKRTISSVLSALSISY